MRAPSVKDPGDTKRLRMLPRSSGPKTQILPKRRGKYSFSSCDALPTAWNKSPFSLLLSKPAVCLLSPFGFRCFSRSRELLQEGGGKKKAAFVKGLAANASKGRTLCLFVLPLTHSF